jgi:hypothetical protein
VFSRPHQLDPLEASITWSPFPTFCSRHSETEMAIPSLTREHSCLLHRRYLAASDLHKELFPTSIDLYYWWISCTPQNDLTRLVQAHKADHMAPGKRIQALADPSASFNEQMSVRGATNVKCNRNWHFGGSKLGGRSFVRCQIMACLRCRIYLSGIGHALALGKLCSFSFFPCTFASILVPYFSPQLQSQYHEALTLSKSSVDVAHAASTGSTLQHIQLRQCDKYTFLRHSSALGELGRDNEAAQCKQFHVNL